MINTKFPNSICRKVLFTLCMLMGIVLSASCMPKQITPSPAATDIPTPQVTPNPTASPVAAEPSPTAAAKFASDGCRIYRNAALGYSLHYPADAQIQTNDEPLNSFSILGPERDGEQWPFITISHPSDREDYRPPEDVALEGRLTDHNLLGDTRQPDVQIAGAIAIHLRHDRSPQSYANDRYFFAKSGQLYMVVIGHTGDKEDWELYNHFLQSIQFEE